jgi:hypothetical protein
MVADGQLGVGVQHDVVQKVSPFFSSRQKLTIHFRMHLEHSPADRIGSHHTTTKTVYNFYELLRWGGGADQTQVQFFRV